jgi:hypothetical protein
MRLERLECRLAIVEQRPKIRMGNLKRLPREYAGERHIVVAKLLPNQGGQEWVRIPRDAGRLTPVVRLDRISAGLNAAELERHLRTRGTELVCAKRGPR